MFHIRRANLALILLCSQVFDKIVSEELAADDGSSSDVDDMTESAAILTAAIRSSATIKNKNKKSVNELISRVFLHIVRSPAIRCIINV